MHRLLLSFILVAAAFLGGCARAKVTTEIKTAGLTERTIEYTGQANDGQGMSMGPKLEESFKLPAGAGWTVKETKTDKDRTVTARRALGLDEVAKGDITVRDKDPNKVFVVNEVSVKRLAPKRFEYREVLKWTAPPLEGFVKPDEATLKEIKAVLPAGLATDENAKGFLDKAAALLVPMMFGPGEPLLAISLFHPDLAERRARQRVGATLAQVLEQQFGDKLTPQQRRDTVRKMLDTSFGPNKIRSQAGPDSMGPGGGGAKNSGAFVPLTFILKTSGKVVESNGETDAISGEVFWAMFSEAAAIGEVVLRAVVEMP
jgi:hypothetical protein